MHSLRNTKHNICCHAFISDLMVQRNCNENSKRVPRTVSRMKSVVWDDQRCDARHGAHITTCQRPQVPSSFSFSIHVTDARHRDARTRRALNTIAQRGHTIWHTCQASRNEESVFYRAKTSTHDDDGNENDVDEEDNDDHDDDDGYDDCDDNEKTTTRSICTNHAYG